jgi:restriction system protein
MGIILYFFGGSVLILWAFGMFGIGAYLGPEATPIADVIAGLGAALGASLLLMGAAAIRRRGRAEAAALEFVKSQARLFGRKRGQLVFKDDYGIEKTDGWEKEKRHIFAAVIPQYLSKVGHSQSAIQSLNLSADARQRIHAAIEKTALREGETIPIANFSAIASGIDYEKFCAERLRAAGWHAQVTKATGDQGTDIIAEHSGRRGRRVVIQCKFYTSPVGNKAVQEVVAARLHERADIAVVVSNATYTKSARQLAGTTGVVLLHHDELSSLIDRLN